MTIDQAPAKLLKAFVPLAAATLFLSASIDIVAQVGPVATGLLADAESVVRNLFHQQLMR